MTESFHISGLVVHSHLEHIATVSRALAEIEGCELHSQTDDGKLVVTLERPNQNSSNDAITEINELDGVVNTALAYHRVEQL